ncbi:MAG: hypothetical protein V7L23_30825 [Nostoc sp.]
MSIGHGALGMGNVDKGVLGLASHRYQRRTNISGNDVGGNLAV